MAGWALLPLRAFLGWTFLFAGLQKLTNPGFFTASNPASIQAQLAGAARRSPIHALLTHLGHLAVPLGIGIALGELAIGLGTLLGLWTRIAATAGALISFSLFLAISFHSNPYYTGSDIVFVFAWIPLIIAGSGNVLSLDGAIANASRYRRGASPEAVVPIPFTMVRSVCGSFVNGSCSAMRGAVCAPGPCPYLARAREAVSPSEGTQIERRVVVTKGAAAACVAGTGVLLAGLSAGLGRAIGGVKSSPTSVLGLKPFEGATTAPTTETTRGHTTHTTSPASAPTTATTHGGATTGSTPPGTAIGLANQVPVGGAAQFGDPQTGDPSLVIQPQAGTFLAFDAVCPHAGCTVQYQQSEFVCPCHGSVFNGTTGAVEAGPAPTGLQQLPIAQGSNGMLYVN
jgi:thiosulfate dehydrogenase [quinone] large subunit